LAFGAEEFWAAIFIAAGAVGVAYYGYSSHKIGKFFGMVSVPYAALYCALIVTTLSPAAQTVDRQAAVIMSLVSWGLYSRTLFGSMVVKHVPVVHAAAVAIGFVALVLIPLFAVRELSVTLNILYRLAAVAGWTVGARPGFGPKKGR
jgi:hypothetical protein